MPETHVFEVVIASTSNASDLGYMALHDLTKAATFLDPESDGRGYRIIGGHMVQLLSHAYPTPDVINRATVDADAGISPLVATEQDLHEALKKCGYEAVQGNSYTRDSPHGKISIDLLVTPDAEGKPQVLGDRRFDAAPGLSLALAAAPVYVAACVRLRNADKISFTAPLPGVEIAVVMKALAWKKRFQHKDLVDLCTLLGITHRHHRSFPRWGLSDPELTGTRRDAAHALKLVVDEIDRGNLARSALPIKPSELAALIRRYVNLPSR
ncbi:hypothetical protein ACPESR_31125 [Nocardia testacea]|uniref:hypothetical protein n=1 Tax=Nocardia testacea TaxID=248551 RepID=UPI003C2C5DCB